MKPIVLIGSAPGVHDDLARLGDLSGFDIMAIGLSGVREYPDMLQFVANNHPENNATIREILSQRGISGYRVIEPFEAPGADIVFSYSAPSGSSSITGALCALRLGYRKIILAGCPLTGNAPAGNPYEEFRAGWEAKKSHVIGIVKSMSGWTAEFLGEPTEEWINTPFAQRWDVLIDLGLKHDWKRGAELGVWYGMTFFKLLDELPELFLIGVDDWRSISHYPHHNDQAENREQVLLRQLKYAKRSIIMEMPTNEAAREISDDSLDFVFIDSFDFESAYEEVKEEIRTWRPKVKPGGFLTGHGYDFSDVKRAVVECLVEVETGDYMKSTWAWRRP